MKDKLGSVLGETAKLVREVGREVGDRLEEVGERLDDASVVETAREEARRAGTKANGVFEELGGAAGPAVESALDDVGDLLKGVARRLRSRREDRAGDEGEE